MGYPSGPPPHWAAPPPRPPQRSGLPGWAWALIGVAATVAVLFALLLVIGIAAAPDRTTSTGTSSTGRTPPTSATRPAAPPTPAASAAPLRTPVSDGAFAQFEVTGTQTGITTIGEFLTENAQGVYTLIDVTVTNTSDRPISFSLSQQTVRDTAGRAYQLDDSATVIANDNTSWITDINPGNSVNAVLVVDMPTTSTPATIALRASGGRPVTIALT